MELTYTSNTRGEGFTIENKQIKCKRELKLVGITIDEKLTYTKHIANICSLVNSTSRYGTEAICFKGSLIWNTVPNKIKNVDNIEDFKKHIKGWKPTACSYLLTVSVITVYCNFGFCYILIWFC